jgi:hypothetical protein
MAPVNRGDSARLLEVRCPIDRRARRHRPQLLSPHLPGCGLGADAGGDRVWLLQQVVKFGFLLFELRFPHGELRLLLLELGFLLAKLRLPLIEVGFPPAKLRFPLSKLGFVLSDFGLVLGELGLALHNLGFPIAKLGDLLGKRRSPVGDLGFLVAELVIVLANFGFVPANFAFVLVQDGFPLSKLGFSLLEPPVPVAQLCVAVTELGVLFDVPNQLLLDQVDKQIHFLLAIATLTDARPGERDIMNIGRRESHCSSPEIFDVSATPKCGALRLRIMPFSRWHLGLPLNSWTSVSRQTGTTRRGLLRSDRPDHRARRLSTSQPSLRFALVHIDALLDRQLRPARTSPNTRFQRHRKDSPGRLAESPPEIC